MQREYNADRKAHAAFIEARGRESLVRRWETDNGVTRGEFLQAWEDAFGAPPDAPISQ